MNHSPAQTVALLVALLIGSTDVGVAGGLAEPVLEPQAEPCLSFSNLSSVTVGVFGGTAGGDGYGGLTATFASSTAGGRSFQFDAEIGRSGDQMYGSLAGHLALVERGNFLTGVYASASKYEDTEAIWRLGGEVYADFDSISVAAVAGWQSAGNSNAFVQADLGVALGDSSRMIFGVAYEEAGMAKLRFEHDFSGANAMGPTTVYVEGTSREDGDESLVLGVNMTLGGKTGTYCPPEGKSASAAKFRRWSMPNQPLQSTPTPVVSVTRACELSDVPGFTADPGCSYTVGGIVVDGNVAGCAIAGSVCS
jgi:hypothetical protein